jgi:hypothetical protein
MLPPPDSNQPDAPLFVPDASGFFGIRLESIGGYGANVAGRILAEAVAYLELPSDWATSAFCSYQDLRLLGKTPFPRQTSPGLPVTIRSALCSSLWDSTALCLVDNHKVAKSERKHKVAKWPCYASSHIWCFFLRMQYGGPCRVRTYDQPVMSRQL